MSIETCTMLRKVSSALVGDPVIRHAPNDLQGQNDQGRPGRERRREETRTDDGRIPEMAARQAQRKEKP